MPLASETHSGGTTKQCLTSKWFRVCKAAHMEISEAEMEQLRWDVVQVSAPVGLLAALSDAGFISLGAIGDAVQFEVDYPAGFKRFKETTRELCSHFDCTAHLITYPDRIPIAGAYLEITGSAVSDLVEPYTPPRNNVVTFPRGDAYGH